MFDCCNRKVDCNLRFNYNAKKMELMEDLKVNEGTNNIVVLSSDGENKNLYENFFRKQFDK